MVRLISVVKYNNKEKIKKEMLMSGPALRAIIKNSTALVNGG